MKRILSAISIIGLCIIHAGWAYAGDLTVDGKMGIGTTGQMSGIASAKLTVMQTPSTNDWTVGIKGGMNTGGSYGLRIDAGTSSNDYSFYVNNSNSSNLFNVRGDGNVGIGTASPQHGLTIHKTINSGCDPSDPYMCSYGFDESTTQWTTSFTGNGRYDGLAIGMNFDNSARIVNYEYGGITLETGGSTRLRVSSYDNVALGQYAVSAYGSLKANGSLDVTGNLSKGSGTFHIDHPLDPLNKDLYHGFVEAPRYDLIYRGMVQLKNGRATVNIDAASSMSNGTFEALTQNRQVFLQNDSGFAAVKGKVKKGTLTIECADAKSNDTIGWLVMAERADAYVKSNGTTDANGHLLVEVDKPEPTADELALLKDKVEVVADDGQASKEDVGAEDVVELSGRRGYPIHPKAFGKTQPQRKVTRKHVRKAASPAAHGFE